MTCALRIPALLAITTLTCGPACSGENLVAGDKEFVVGGLRAKGSEIVRKSGTGKTLVQREGRLIDGGDGVRLLAELNAQGHVTSASFRREGFWGKRYVELRASATSPGRMEPTSRGNDEIVVLPPGPIVLTDELPAQASSGELVRVDLEHALVVSAAVGRAPAADDVVTGAHTQREPFIETTARIVVDWCKQQSAERDPVKAARAFADAVKPKLAPDRRHGAPGALNTATYGGYDQGGAALIVACARVLGHPARIVTGTVDGGGAPAGVKLARTWAQVHDGTRWRDVDPLDTRAPDGEPASAHIALHEGMPSVPVVGARPSAP